MTVWGVPIGGNRCVCGKCEEVAPIADHAPCLQDVLVGHTVQGQETGWVGLKRRPHPSDAWDKVSNVKIVRLCVMDLVHIIEPVQWPET